MTVYLLTTGEGCDGDEWYVVSIHSTRENAERAKVDHDTTKHMRPDGSHYFSYANEIEEWPLDPVNEESPPAATGELPVT